MVRVVFGIFEFQEFAEGGVVDFRRSGLVLGARLILHQESSDVREGSGATRGDAVAGERFKEFAEDMVDVDVGDVIAGETGEFGGKVGLWRGWRGAVSVTKMGEAQALSFGMGGKGATAAIGELELAKGGIGRSFVGHSEKSLAKKYYIVNIPTCTDGAHFILAFEYLWKSGGDLARLRP